MQNEKDYTVVARCGNFEPYKAGYEDGRKQGRKETLKAVIEMLETNVDFKNAEDKEMVCEIIRSLLDGESATNPCDVN